jgi:hypothetical protein
MKYANLLAFVGVAALLSACGGDDGDDNDMESNANQPGGGGGGGAVDDDCIGTVTGGPHPGPLSCVILATYYAQPSFAAATPDVTVLRVSGGLNDNSGGIDQSLAIRGRPMVQSYPELVNEPMMGLVRMGTQGFLDFNDENPSLFYADAGSVTLTEVSMNPGGSIALSGSATWEVATSDFAETEASATISITFRNQD